MQITSRVEAAYFHIWNARCNIESALLWSHDNPLLKEAYAECARAIQELGEMMREERELQSKDNRG